MKLGELNSSTDVVLLDELSSFFTESTGFTPPEKVAGALKNSLLEKSIVLAVTENFTDADTTSYGGQN